MDSKLEVGQSAKVATDSPTSPALFLTWTFTFVSSAPLPLHVVLYHLLLIEMSAEALSSVEAKRLELERNVAKLEADLRHWRTWDAEYEVLKEDLKGLSDAATEDDILRIATEFDGELLTKKEIDQITGINKANIRDPKYVIRTIEQRQDYVTQNISTITKQVESMKAVLENLDSAEATGTSTESVLPISEIIEELDDDDNIVSSKVQNPEDVTAQLVDALRQTGVTDIGAKTTIANQATSTPPASETEDLSVKEDGATTQMTSNGQAKAKKVFEPPKSADRFSQSSGDKVANAGSRPLSEDLLSGSFRPGDRVIEINDDDEVLASGAILPKDESPEDARLRREMLEYHLNEVGNVVAEIDLLEGDSDDDDDFTDELAGMDDQSVNSDMSEEEDEHGRSLRPTVTDGMRQQMADLEKRLKGQFMANMGPDYDPDQVKESPSAIAEPSQKRDETSTIATKGGAKSVRFAEDLDVSPAPKAVLQQQIRPLKDQPTMAHTLVERPAGQKTKEEVQSAGTKKISRFKASRAPTEPKAPSQATRILSSNLVERANTGPPPTEPPEDDFDPELQRRQLAARYYELRNEEIRKQGGFKAPEEEEDHGEGPLMEEMADGRVKKVSRFKAARMNH